ncbi:FAD-dependent oxidoreductase, partial [Chloroflexota bacterium]
YRGGGPRISHYKNPISFDGWLLGQARERGAKIENETVSRIHLGQEAQVEVDGMKLGFDLVVLAAGVNARPVPVLGLDYVHPKTRTMALTELHAGTAQVESCLGNMAHAFLIPRSGMIFGTLVPKGPFINVSVLSSKRPVSMDDFLSYEMVKDILPKDYTRACNCQPRVVTTPARNYYTDGFVAVGDAVVSRLYKDGIGSSSLTARLAASVAVHHGVSHKNFQQYYQPFCSAMNRDNWWGRLLFSMNDRIKDSRVLLLAQHRLIGDEQKNASGPQPFSKAAWGMFTGNFSYRSITNMTLNPASQMRLLAALFREGLTSWSHSEFTRPRKLHVGSKKVLILGSGFGGTYALRRLVPSLNRNEKIETTMVSDENFFLFSPLLHEVAMGGIETRHVAYPIRRLHWRDRFNFVQASVERIDLSNRKVITTKGTLGFDYLILALGSITKVPKFDSAGGEERDIFTLGTLWDSMLIRNHIIGVFEQASAEENPELQRQLLTFIVSGAGYTGVQVVTELRDFIHRSLVRFYKAIDPDNIKIILVEAEPKIVAGLHVKLGAYAMKCLQRMGIEVRLRSRITRVWKDSVEINSGEIVPAATLIWVAGVVAHPRIAELDAAKDSIGRVLVNEYLEVPSVPGTYAVGDCAHFDDPKTGKAIPPRAHTAVRQAKIAAHNILAEIRGWDKKPYRYSNPAEIVSLGASKAMFRIYGLRLYGF